MECMLEAAPLPEITWWQGTKQITQSDRIKMNQKDMGKDSYLLSLEISSPVIGDGGSWRCNAVNACGESNANISLNFQGTRDNATCPTVALQQQPYTITFVNSPDLSATLFKV